MRQFLLSALCLYTDIIGLGLYAGERNALLFAGLFCLALPFFLSSAIAIAETK